MTIMYKAACIVGTVIGITQANVVTPSEKFLGLTEHVNERATNTNRVRRRLPMIELTDMTPYRKRKEAELKEAELRKNAEEIVLSKMNKCKVIENPSLNVSFMNNFGELLSHKQNDCHEYVELVAEISRRMRITDNIIGIKTIELDSDRKPTLIRIKYKESDESKQTEWILHKRVQLGWILVPDPVQYAELKEAELKKEAEEIVRSKIDEDCKVIDHRFDDFEFLTGLPDDKKNEYVKLVAEVIRKMHITYKIENIKTIELNQNGKPTLIRIEYLDETDKLTDRILYKRVHVVDVTDTETNDTIKQLKFRWIGPLTEKALTEQRARPELPEW